MPWTCPRCTLVNPDGARVCGGCEIGISELTVPELKKILNNARVNYSTALEKPELVKLLMNVGTTPSAGWACPVCTLVNEAGASVCGACGKAKPPASLPARPPPSPASASAPPSSPLNGLLRAMPGLRPAGADTSRFRGLQNIGNTCWMNSSLQALFSCEDFANVFIRSRGKLPQLREPAGLARALIDTYSACEESPVGTVVAPRAFKAELEKLNREYRGEEQKDAGIFFTHLFGLLEVQMGHPAGVRPMLWEPTLFTDGLPAPSILRDLHGIKQIISRTCNLCEESRKQTGYNDMLRLSIPKPRADGKRLTLMNCFEAFSEGILYEGEDMLRCLNCTEEARKKRLSLKLNPSNVNVAESYQQSDANPEKTPHTVKTIFENSPEMLVVNILRFDMLKPGIAKKSNTPVGIAKKSNTPVSIPLVLDTLGPLVEPAQDSAYVLTGVVCHEGTIRGGHYIAKVMKPNREWLLCNDSSITHIPKEVFEKDMLEQTGGFNAVVMVYSKGWKCGICGLVNTSKEVACAVCGAPKPGEAGGAKGGSLAKRRKTKRRKYTKRRRVCRTRHIKKQNRS
jgi:ubiquitin C-terminal hydrolase